MSRQNPFEITKAVDFTDKQINHFWVDLEDGGFRGVVCPTSPTPILILGGKGCGKTHIMRYFSFPLQRVRSNGDLLETIKADGYIGIYLLCSGLNAERFTQKGGDPALWEAVYAYYMDLCLAQLTLLTVEEVFATSPELAAKEEAICRDVLDLFDVADFPAFQSLAGLLQRLKAFQKDADAQINNWPRTRALDIRIRATIGRLVFDIPRILADHLPALASVMFLYMIDELESLPEAHQRYVQTLIRERTGPCTFRVGARLYGIRTRRTYGGEENRENSEYRTIYLDDLLRGNKAYATFARRMLARRLEPEMDEQSASQVNNVMQKLEAQLQKSDIPDDPLTHASMAVQKYAGRERPYFERLREELSKGKSHSLAPGVTSDEHVRHIIQLLTRSEYPLLEKVNIFLLYKDWYAKHDLLKAAEEIKNLCEGYIAGQRGNRYTAAISHSSGDLFAQLLKQCGYQQRYLGLNTFIWMSHGLPRYLLTVLREVFKWAEFNGQQPLDGGLIKLNSQRAGVEDASEAFLTDVRPIDIDGQTIETAIKHLAEFFREIRFSDKPSECSLVAFSVNLSLVSENAFRIIESCAQHSYLIEIDRGQRDRNSRRVDAKYQLNRMLAPRWDLPLARRGTIALQPDEVNAIFDPGFASEFRAVRDGRKSKMTAPWFGKSRKRESSRGQMALVETDED